MGRFACMKCPKRTTCQVPCAQIEARLPQETDGTRIGHSAKLVPWGLMVHYEDGKQWKHPLRLDGIAKHRESIRAALDNTDVTDRTRRVSETYHWQGKTGRQTAKAHRIKVSTVRYHLKRFRKAIQRRSLDDSGAMS